VTRNGVGTVDSVVQTRFLRLLLGLLAGALLAVAPAAAGSHRVLVALFDNDVNPVTEDFLQAQIERGEREGFAAVVIEMDTPGGLASSMRNIVKTIIAADVPVVVYVSPGGSSADSAGAVIGQAADVLAMAPQTNIGSSTPISTGGQDLSDDLRRKVVNDAAAYIGELAREHGRNVKAAEAMVRQASNFGAREALDKNIVDVISPSLEQLLVDIDGKVTKPKGLTLETDGAAVTRAEMGFWKKALDLLVDPNLIALMLSLGLIGIVVELWNPGLVFPGTVGAISLIVGLYGLQVLPISLAGALLMLLAAAFFVAEAFVPSHGALTAAGVVMFVIGSLMLFDPAGPAYQVSLWTAIAVAGTLALLFGVALNRVWKARGAPVEVDVHRLVGAEGVARRPGYVFVGGELWRARVAGDGVLAPGTPVRVEAVEDGLQVLVSPSTPEERRAS
jgi:membrane-bound serine protease (ClpP class)